MSLGPAFSVDLAVVPEDAASRLPTGRLRRAVEAALESEGVREAEISLALMNDESMERLNRQHLDRSGPTDVLAFGLGAPDAPPLGDIYVGWETAQRQAREFDVELEEELVRLTIHGVLHVLGYDHPEGDGREESDHFRRQEALVRRVMG